MPKLERRVKGRELTIKTSPKVKMSDLIREYASDYTNMGEDAEERQDYLNKACTLEHRHPR